MLGTARAGKKSAITEVLFNFKHEHNIQSYKVTQVNTCSFCAASGGKLIWENRYFRVVAPDEPQYPGFVRIISQEHLTEFTQLTLPQREELMSLLAAIEGEMIAAMNPIKVNLASLGNQVAHHHWHVIPRFADDPCFPDAIWSAPKRAVSQDVLDTRRKQASKFLAALAQKLQKSA